MARFSLWIYSWLTGDNLHLVSSHGNENKRWKERQRARERGKRDFPCSLNFHYLLKIPLSREGPFSWAKLCLLPWSLNPYIEVLTPSVTIFADMTFSEELRLNEGSRLGIVVTQ